MKIIMIINLAIVKKDQLMYVKLNNLILFIIGI